MPPWSGSSAPRSPGSVRTGRRSPSPRPPCLTLVAGVVAVGAGLQEDGSVVDVLALSAMFAGLYAAAAWLFRSAAPRAA